MLRPLFLVLLLFNAVLLAWQFNLLAPLGLPALPPVGEPERLQQQVQPERLQVRPLPASAAAQALEATASSASDNAASPDTAGQARSTASAP